ncbi:putative endonuclease [Synechococcus phage S-CBWM1]|uniref:Putative endonuclease n=1 Tax=Synechococcus phage S-CBWM1 TaxID=2053653 RepID=A0A3G1L3D8_9CAUD|nr:putative endonuclease [Synechococcus phage S-CBWM1]ATW62703.1 putative endonuclease [Synechococcus phage S-CBWM1]
MAKKGEIPPWGDPDLVVEVSFTQHLMFHWCNYQLWGNLEDKAAHAFMRGCGEEGQLAASKLATEVRLAKIASDPEFADKVRENVREMSKLFQAKRKNDPEFREKMREISLSAGVAGRIAALSTESRAKRLETFKENKHQQGTRNSQYGTMWVTDGETNRKIKKGEPIPEGFRAGRVYK